MTAGPQVRAVVFTNLARLVFALLALAMLGLGAFLLGRGQPGFLGPLIGGGVILIGVVFERWRYKPTQASAGPGFHPTRERFADPTSGERLQVWVNAAGERRYVREP